MTIGIVATVVGLVGALMLSPRFPIGLARARRAGRRFHADWVVLLPGAVVILLAVTVIGTVGAFTRRSRRAARPAVHATHVVDSLGVVASISGRLTAEQNGAAPQLRAVVVALVGALAIVTGSLVYLNSNDHLHDHPALFGATWDVQAAIDPGTATGALAALDDDPGVTATAVMRSGRVDVGGGSYPATGVLGGRGELGPTILEGRRGAAAR